MKFAYRKYTEQGVVVSSEPMIKVRLAYKNKQQTMWALVDSGANVCVFHASYATVLGIDLESGREFPITGISGDEIPAYVHPVRLTVPPLKGVDIDVAFTHADGLEDGAILGQLGFFDAYQVVFERYRDAIYVKHKDDVA
jgi:hypothetical protein